MDTYKTKIRPWIAIIGLIILGILMIIQPGAWGRR